MSNYITNIKVNEIFHLKDFNISLGTEEKKHLIITGKNGSGKTILLNAIIDHLSRVCNDATMNFLTLKKQIAQSQDWIKNAESQNDQQRVASFQNSIKYSEQEFYNFFGKVELSFKDIYSLAKDFQNRTFILAYYADERKSRFIEPQNPVKPNLTFNTHDVKQSKVDQFLNFMVDYKVQEALARNEGKLNDAESIREWFDDFTIILRQIFDDPELILSFNYRDYTFRLESKDKSFKFTELSAGYSAALDIVTDLILKMQSQDRITRMYEKEGIVLIDEIETHLHLELQRVILPLLTKIFPHIQFIVTTHSPFVLNSLKDAVAFDLEQMKSIEDLTDYSYEALAEGYFGVQTESSEIQMRLQRMGELIKLTELSASEQLELDMYLHDFEQLPEVVAPHVKAKYYELKRMWQAKA